MAPTSEGQVVREQIALRRKSMEYLRRDGQVAADAYFCAEPKRPHCSGREQYYRAMFRRDHSSWNQRDTHMMRSLMALTDHLNKQRSPAKIIVWAHNSHRRHLPTRHRTSQSLLHCASLRSVRLRVAFRSYSGGRTAGAQRRMGARRSRRELSDRDLIILERRT